VQELVLASVRTAFSSSPLFTSLNELPCSVILFFALVYFLALIFSLVTYRRRRAAQVNQQHQPNGGSAYNGYDGLQPYAPQYPPQTQGGPGGVPDHAYDPNSGFAPVRLTRLPRYSS